MTASRQPPGPKRAQDSSKTDPRRPQTGPDPPKTNPRRPKRGPRQAQTHPRQAQDSPKPIQKGPIMGRYPVYPSPVEPQSPLFDAATVYWSSTSCHQSVPLAGAARCPSIPANSDMHAIRQHAHGGPPRKPPKNSPKHRHTSTNPHSQRAAASPARRHLEDNLEENHEELQVVLNAPAHDKPKTKSTREAETCSTERRGRPPRSNGLCVMARRNRP